MDTVRAELRQRDYRVRLEWGREGVALLAAECASIVVVDVLSFSTAVDVAVGRGARVLPRRCGDSADVPPGAVRAGRRSGDGPSLSPPSLLGLAPGTVLVLPSPNGATLCTLAAAGTATVFVGCLRNASAVAAAARQAAGVGPIGLVPAGERWPDDTLRVAAEDVIGAGAIAGALADVTERHSRHRGCDESAVRGEPGALSPEAALAAAQFSDARERGLRAVLGDVASGRELIAAGYPGDVDLAAELDASPHAPVMRDACVYSTGNTGHLASWP